MAYREIVLDEPVTNQQDAHLRAAVERAERAEAELAKLKATSAEPKATSAEPMQAVSGEAEGAPAQHEPAQHEPAQHEPAQHEPALHGLEALRKDAMMRHLLGSLDAGKDIGHYGRLVFAMVARHFLSQEEMLAELTRDPDFTQEQARVLLHQVEDRDYSPPRRERIVEWQAQQEFPILPSPDDPDCGSVYRTLHFPDKTYKHIEQYQEERLQSES